jgi:hypothetical protein
MEGDDDDDDDDDDDPFMIQCDIHTHTHTHTHVEFLPDIVKTIGKLILIFQFFFLSKRKK